MDDPTQSILTAIKDSNAAMVSVIERTAHSTEKAVERLANAIENIPAISDRLPKDGTNGGRQVVVLFVAILAAVMSPALVMVSAQQASITEIKTSITADDIQERQDAAMTAAQRERFKEAETQFADLHRRVGEIEEWRIWWNRSKHSSAGFGAAPDTVPDK